MKDVKDRSKGEQLLWFMDLCAAADNLVAHLKKHVDITSPKKVAVQLRQVIERVLAEVADNVIPNTEETENEWMEALRSFQAHFAVDFDKAVINEEVLKIGKALISEEIIEELCEKHEREK